VRRLLCSKPAKAADQKWDMPAASDTPTLDECDKKARLLVARIAGVGAALAIGFLAAELF
jgi:hypothetical protein